MNATKKNIRRVFWLYFALFMLIVGTIIKLVLFDHIPNNSYNQRISRIDAEILRGSILDANGVELAKSESQNGYARSYPQGREFAHVVGYLEKGKFGLELAANFRLQTLKNEIAQRVNQVVTGEDLKGNDMYTTLDASLQSLAYQQLGNKKGGIVALEPSTGRILAMVSNPSFNPNTISADWNDIVADTEGSALINRVTQGLYPPGSVFKLITAAAALMSDQDELQNFVYTCTGEDKFGGYIIHCYDNKAHGEINMQQALSVSCNCYFAQVGNRLGADALKRVGEQFLFNKPLPYEMAAHTSRLLTDFDSDAATLAQTAIGQGKTLVSPLHMALVGAAIANGGVLMKPYCMAYEESYNGIISNRRLPEKAADVISAELAVILKDMMVSVVETGTGTGAKISGISVAGKTGTAQNEKDADHGWFVCFAPADNPQVVVAVILENGGSGSNAVPIAKKIIEQVCRN